MSPFSSRTSTSTVGLPRESRTSRAMISSIRVDIDAPSVKRKTSNVKAASAFTFYVLTGHHPKLVIQTGEVELLVEQSGEAFDLGGLLETNMAEDPLGALDRRQCVVGNQDDRYLALLGAVDHLRHRADVTGQHQYRSRSFQRGQLDVGAIAASEDRFVIAAAEVGQRTRRTHRTDHKLFDELAQPSLAADHLAAQVLQQFADSDARQLRFLRNRPQNRDAALFEIRHDTVAREVELRFLDLVEQHTEQPVADVVLNREDRIQRGYAAVAGDQQDRRLEHVGKLVGREIDD